MASSEKVLVARSPRKRPLDEEYRELDDRIIIAKKQLRPHGSFNAKFWARAAEIEDLIAQKNRVNRCILLRDFHGLKAEWENTEEAKEICEKIKAHELQQQILSRRSKELSTKKSSGNLLRRCFMTLFTTSKMGIGIRETGAGKRDRELQRNFRKALIESYGSANTSASVDEPRVLWCPVLGRWIHDNEVKAGHLFAYMHGQETMDAIFGPQKEPELFSPLNGLLISQRIEEFFDSGKLVIVPDLCDQPTMADIKTWVGQTTREYKLRIIDKTWKMLPEKVHLFLDVTWADLDNKRLQFRNSFRPRARYLYFHYCVQVLRHVWRQDPNDAADILKDESGKPMWPTRGRYLNKKMLRAFVQELGHEQYEDLLNGSSCRFRGDANLLLDVTSRQVAESNRRDDYDSDTDEEDDSNDGSGSRLS